MRKYDLVIFDLDGTLLDTSEGIFGSVRYAEQKLGLLSAAEEQLKVFLGPPPKEMYQKVYQLDEKTALEATQYHREYGREKAIYQAKVYPNMLECLQQLKKQGIKLAVATLKSQDIAETILNHFGLAQYFDCIIGMDGKEGLKKSEIIRKVMEKTLISDKVLMVGDSIYDLQGAKEAEVEFLGVLYGFGLKEESELKKCKLVINNILEIMKYMELDIC